MASNPGESQTPDHLTIPTPDQVQAHFTNNFKMPSSGGGYDGAKKHKGSKVHAVVDTLGHLLAPK